MCKYDLTSSDRQTDRHARNYIPCRFADGQQQITNNTKCKKLTECTASCLQRAHAQIDVLLKSSAARLMLQPEVLHAVYVALVEDSRQVATDVVLLHHLLTPRQNKLMVYKKTVK